MSIEVTKRLMSNKFWVKGGKNVKLTEQNKKKVSDDFKVFDRTFHLNFIIYFEH